MSNSGKGCRSLAEDLHAARLRGAEAFAVCLPGALCERPITERHRLVFYLGHMEAFDWNLVCRGHLDEPSFHPSFDRLFAFGIDPPVGSAPADTPADWSSIEEIQSYNRRVLETIWTESSHKYRLEDLDSLAREAGFRAHRQWIDAEWPFAETLLQDGDPVSLRAEGI